MGVTHSFHHKYAIADANSISSDPTILTGSHNWSSNAENNSDENTIIIHDATIANIYLQEFTQRFNELATVTQTWVCDGQGNCSDPGTGQGTYASLSACQNNCIVVASTWDCDGQGNCSDPGTGQGTYASLSACQNNCIQTSVYVEAIESLMIYPNPTDQIVNIQFSIIVKQSIKIRVINTIGEIVFVEDLQNYFGDYSKKINLEGYSRGIYFLKIIADKGATVRKVIVE